MAKFCTNCGSKLPEGVKFCTECGTAVEAEVPAVKGTDEPKKAAAPIGQTASGVVINAPKGSTVSVSDVPPQVVSSPKPKAAAAVPEEKRQPVREGGKKNEKTKNGRRGLTLFLVLVMLIELAVAAFGCPGFLRREKKNGGDLPDFSSGKSETFTADVGFEQPAARCGDVSVEMNWWDLDGDDRLVVRTSPGRSDSAIGAERYAYEISLSSGRHEFTTDAVVTLPRHAGDRDKGVVMHYNASSGEWEEVYTEISGDGKSYLVYTDHFSFFEEWVYRNMFAGVGNDGDGIFREKSTGGNRMLAPVEVDKDALTEVYKGEKDELPKRVLELTKAGVVLDAQNRYTYADIGGNLIGFAEKGNTLGLYESVLTESGQKALGGWLSKAGYLCTALKLYNRMQAGETVGEALWKEKEEVGFTLASAAAGTAGFPTVAFVISSVPLMMWMDKQTENLAEWSRTYLGFNNRDKLYLANVKEARYEEFFGYYDANPVVLLAGDKSFSLQADGKGWEELIDYAFSSNESTPEMITVMLENTYTAYVNYYHNLSQSERNEWYYSLCESQGKLKAVNYPQPTEDMMTAYRTELTANIKKRTMAMVQKRLEKSQRDAVDELIAELNAIVIPLLNQKLVFSVESDETFGDTPRGKPEPPMKGSKRTTAKPRLHFLDLFEPSDALFFPIGADEESYPENAFLPSPSPGSSVVFECTWFHYLMMGMPTTMVFDGFVENEEDYDELIRDFKVEKIDGEGTLEIPIALNEDFSLSFFMGDWEGTYEGMKVEFSLYMHEDYISLAEEIGGDTSWSKIKKYSFDPATKTFSTPYEEKEHHAAELKAIRWDGSGPDAMDFTVDGTTIHLTRTESDDDD